MEMALPQKKKGKIKGGVRKLERWGRKDIRNVPETFFIPRGLTMSDGKWIIGLTPSMPLVEAAYIVLPNRFNVVAHFLPLAAGSAAKDIEHVHQLRVASRRAASALELFALCLPKKLEKRLRRLLRTLRRAAGAARDWDVFLTMLQSSKLFSAANAKPARNLLLGVSLRAAWPNRGISSALPPPKENVFSMKLRN